MNKQNRPNKSNKQVMVNFVTTADQKTAAAHAVRRLGYMTLSEFLREKMQQAIKEAEQPARAA